MTPDNQFRLMNGLEPIMPITNPRRNIERELMRVSPSQFKGKKGKRTLRRLADTSLRLEIMNQIDVQNHPNGVLAKLISPDGTGWAWQKNGMPTNMADPVYTPNLLNWASTQVWWGDERIKIKDNTLAETLTAITIAFSEERISDAQYGKSTRDAVVATVHVYDNLVRGIVTDTTDTSD